MNLSPSRPRAAVSLFLSWVIQQQGLCVTAKVSVHVCQWRVAILPIGLAAVGCQVFDTQENPLSP